MLLVATVAAAAVLLNDQTGEVSSPGPETRAFVVGDGARAAMVLPALGGRRRPTVVFLHGWGLTGSQAYAAWLRHLARRGSTVIVPRYQTSLRTPSRSTPDAALSGVRFALRAVSPRPRAVVVVGHSAGAVLAVDYAARAETLGLPPARAVMAIFPGSAIRNMPPVPSAGPELLPETVRQLLVMASPSDDVVGTVPAQEIYDGAVRVAPERRRLVSVADRLAGDHFAPAVDSAAARRTFWSALDDLLTAG